MSRRVTILLLAFAMAVGGLWFVRPQQVKAGALNEPTILVHGYNDGSAINCNVGSMWGTVRSFFGNSSNRYTNTLSVGFYKGDTNCNAYLSSESSHCATWYDSGSLDGTVNEDIRHTTCLLAWYIWDHYTSGGQTVAVIAHSMGGILVRQAMFDTPYIGAFPPWVKVSDAVTAGSPHQGLADDAAWEQERTGCPGNCQEVYQMQVSNPLMSNLNSTSFRNGFGRNPQGSGGTDWTNIASYYDDVLGSCTMDQYWVGAPEEVENCGLMPGATHFVCYPGSYPHYGHGDYLTDTSTTWDADESYSDNNGGTWYTVNNSAHSILTMYYAVQYSTW